MYNNDNDDAVLVVLVLVAIKKGNLFGCSRLGMGFRLFVQPPTDPRPFILLNIFFSMYENSTIQAA